MYKTTLNNTKKKRNPKIQRKKNFSHKNSNPINNSYKISILTKIRTNHISKHFINKNSTKYQTQIPVNAKHLKTSKISK